MSGKTADNLRIAIKVTSYFVVLLGLVFFLSLALANSGKEINNPLGIYPEEPTGLQLIVSVLFAGLVLLTFVLPLLVLRRELQKRKER
jgi:hypothetical protein